jgi:hypothetical protein
MTIKDILEVRPFKVGVNLKKRLSMTAVLCWKPEPPQSSLAPEKDLSISDTPTLKRGKKPVKRKLFKKDSKKEKDNKKGDIKKEKDSKKRDIKKEKDSKKRDIKKENEKKKVSKREDSKREDSKKKVNKRPISAGLAERNSSAKRLPISLSNVRIRARDTIKEEDNNAESISGLPSLEKLLKDGKK